MVELLSVSSLFCLLTEKSVSKAQELLNSQRHKKERQGETTTLKISYDVLKTNNNGKFYIINGTYSITDLKWSRTAKNPYEES